MLFDTHFVIYVFVHILLGAVPVTQPAPTPGNSPCVPVPRQTVNNWWMNMHQALVRQARQGGIDLVFLGDSITMMWKSQSGYEGGTPVWEKYYRPLKAANFGISGDGTQHLLWRITEGHELDGLHPKVVVLLIGINNLTGVHGAVTPEQVAQGIQCNVSCLRAKLPEAKVLLLGIFPCQESPKNPIRAAVRRANARIARLEDRQHVFFLDLGDRFLEPDGTIKKDKLRDYLHLSEKGYGIWAKTMHPYLLDLLNNEGKGTVWKTRVLATNKSQS